MVHVMSDDKYVCNLSPDLLRKARENLGETPELRESSILAIREWLQENKYLNADSSDRGILRFLRTCKYNLSDTKKRIESYYTVKTAAPEFYANWDPTEPDMDHIIRSGIFLPLRDHDEEGHVVIILRVGAIDPQMHKLEDIVRAAMMIYAIILKETENLQICGQVMIMDLSHLSVSVAGMIQPSVLKRSIKCWQDCSPSRVKGVHYFKANTLFHGLFKIIKPLLKEKMRKREYGGTRGSVNDIIEHWVQKMEENREWLKQQESFKADSRKRKGSKPTDYKKELFGNDDSFRNLEID